MPAFLTLTDILLIVVYTITLFTMIRIVMVSRNASKAVGYLLLVITAPLIGSNHLLFAGGQLSQEKIYSKEPIANDTLMDRIRESIISSAHACVLF